MFTLLKNSDNEQNEDSNEFEEKREF